MRAAACSFSARGEFGGSFRKNGSQQRGGRPGHHFDRLFAGEPGDIGQPYERFDADGAPDRQRKPMQRWIWQTPTQGSQRLLDPYNRSSSPER